MNKIQLIIAVAVSVVILLLGWVAYHYHSEWVSVKEDYARLQVSTAQITTTLESCSSKVKELKEADEAKENGIREAQAQAAILARNNETLAQSLLNSKPSNKDSCKAAVKLYQEYKNGEVTK